MKKLLLLLLCVPFIFSCGENKKINELEEEIEDLHDKIDELDKKDDNQNLYELDNLELEDLEEREIEITRPSAPPNTYKEVPQEIPEEIEIIENKDIITSKEGEIKVPEPEPEPEPLTEEEQAFDKNNNGKIDVEEQKKLDEFLEKIGNVGIGEHDYNGRGEEGEGNGTGEGKGFGDGLDWVNSYNNIDPATLDCDLGKGTGGLTITIIRSSYGKIVEFDQTSFESTLTGFTFSSDQQIKRLLVCIKKEYNEAIYNGEKVKIYEKDHLHTLKLDFKN